MIQLEGVSKTFKGPQGEDVVAVASLRLEVGEGETLALIGTSGCGKTTTIRMINRLIEPTKGRILIDDSDVRAEDPVRLRRRIGYVVQQGGLFPHMTVAHNIGLLNELEGWKAADTERRVHELLKLVNLEPNPFATRYPRELSGGQRQRVGVARALALDPKYILMDEPFGALDPITRDQLHEEFLSLKKAVKKTIIIVTHDMAEAFLLADRVALMNQGRLIQIGSEEDFRERPANGFVADFVKSHIARAGAS